MYTITDILEDINRNCAIYNMNENRFSYRIIFYINDDDKSSKHYINSTYDNLCREVENIIKNNLSMTNKIAIANVTTLKGGNSICLLSRSYAFSLDGYFRQIVGKREKEYKTANYGRRRSNWC